jgi:hypothetical protein
VPAVEVLNAQIGERSNAAAAKFARCLSKIELAGSDAHTLSSLGIAFTEVAGARTKQEYLLALRQGAARPRGRSGGASQLTSTVLGISRELLRERSWTIVLSPLAAAIPIVTWMSSLSNDVMAAYWSHRLRDRYRDLLVVPLSDEELAA